MFFHSSCSLPSSSLPRVSSSVSSCLVTFRIALDGCSCIPGTIRQDFRGSAPALGSLTWFITLAFPLFPQRDDPSRCCPGSLGSEVFRKPNTLLPESGGWDPGIQDTNSSRLWAWALTNPVSATQTHQAQSQGGRPVRVKPAPEWDGPRLKGRKWG